MSKIPSFALLALYLSTPVQAEVLAFQAKDDCARIQGDNLKDSRRINRRGQREISFYTLCTTAAPEEVNVKHGPHVLFESTLLCCQGLSSGVKREILVNKCGPLGWPSIKGHEDGTHLPKLPREVYKCERDAIQSCAKNRTGPNCIGPGRLN